MLLRYTVAYVRRWWVCAYQHRFPGPFRITPSVAVVWQRSSHCAIVAILAGVGKTMEAGQQETSRSDAIPEAFARNLCNEHFRLASHLAQLDRMDRMDRMVDSPRILRRLQNAALDLQRVFEQYAIEYRDLTGQDYHAGRLDFENIAPAEVDGSLTNPKIVVCEHPAVFLCGKLIQTARGIVARPP